MIACLQVRPPNAHTTGVLSAGSKCPLRVGDHPGQGWWGLKDVLSHSQQEPSLQGPGLHPMGSVPTNGGPPAFAKPVLLCHLSSASKGFSMAALLYWHLGSGSP